MPLLALLLLRPAGAVAGQAVRWMGCLRHLSGVNVPWFGYGADFGTVEEWSHHAYAHDRTEAMFAALRGAGVNCVRWWVFCDGRGAPEFDAAAGGLVTGLDASVLPSLTDVAALAAQYDMLLVFCLWDFAMLFGDGTPGDYGEHAGGHRNLVTEPEARASFVTNALLPILACPVPGSPYRIGTHPNVLAWDVINEPEWAVAESGAVDARVPESVPLEAMRRFVAEVSGTVHRHANQLVTLGSASMKWNSDGALGAAGNWWSDAALEAHDPDGALDFYQVHYYAWMNGDGVWWSYSPLFNTWDRGRFGKPTVIGEFPADTTGLGVNAAELLAGLLAKGYAGAWAWTYTGADSFGGWDKAGDAYTGFGAAHASDIRPPADHDEDGDGAPDRAEYLAGTGPADRQSALRLTHARAEGGDVILTFQGRRAAGPGYGGVNRLYAIEWTPGLRAPRWQPVAGVERVPATDGLQVFRVPATVAPSNAFYRARVWLEDRPPD